MPGGWFRLAEDDRIFFFSARCREWFVRDMHTTLLEFMASTIARRLVLQVRKAWGYPPQGGKPDSYLIQYGDNEVVYM